MEAASNSSPLSGATIAQLAADYIQFRQDTSRTTGTDPNGPHSQLLAQLDKAFLPWLEQALTDSQSTSDQQANINGASVPTPYSTDSIPSDVQTNPGAQFQQSDVGRIQNLATRGAMMAASYRTANDEVGVGDQRATNGAIVRDHRTTVDYSGIAAAGTGGGNVIVRDHRHPEPLPPAAPPAAPPSSSSGTVFTSGSDYDKLNSVNAAFNDAKANALANPTDPAAQQKLADAAAALQVISKLLMQVTSMYASIAEKAIDSSRVSAA
jgi:hypothetical protein